MFQRHAAHDLGFGAVPVLKRNVTTTRDQRIRDLLPFVQAMIGAQGLPSVSSCTAGATAATKDDGSCASAGDAGVKAYNPELVISERQRLLESVGTPLPKRFHEESHVDGLEIIESEEGTAIIREGVFTVRVYTEGHAFRFYNHLAEYNRMGNAPAQLTNSEAEIAGRDLIEHWSLIPGSDLDQLTFFKTRYAHFTGKGHDPGDRTVGTTAFFTRTIDGVSVVSDKGSHIDIEFTAGHAVSYVSADWSPFERSGATQAPVDAATFRARISGKLAALAMDDNSAPVDSEIVRMWCGYLDFGSAFGKTDQMQLGCEVNFHAAGNNRPFVTTVPLGEKVLVENGWSSPELMTAYEKLGRTPSKAVKLLGLPAVAAPTGAALDARAPTLRNAGCSIAHVASGARSQSLTYLGLGALIVLRRRRRA